MNYTVFKHKKGFTLLEVMIALAVFAVAGMVCLETYLMSLRHVHMINQEKKHLLLARWKIEEMRIGKEDIGEKDGIFPQPFENYEWEISLSDTIITDTEYDVTFIPYKLKIIWDEGEYPVTTPFIKTEAGGR